MSRLGAGILLSILSANPCWPQKNPCRPELSEPLRVKTLSLIHSIVVANTESVLKAFGSEGIMIGDSSPIPLAAVRRQFAVKEGLFCLFFDSACMDKPSNRSLWSDDRALRALSGSFREWLKRAGNLNLEINFLDAPVARYCMAAVQVSQSTSIPASVPATIDFGFVYLRGSWEFTQIGAMP